MKTAQAPSPNATEPYIPRVVDETQGKRAVLAAKDNPTDRVTSIVLSRLDMQQEMSGAPPAVAGGQSARVADRANVKIDDRMAGGQREGVSALEPGYNRALRVRSEAGATTLGKAALPNANKAAGVDHDRPERQALAGRIPAQGDHTSPLPTAEVNRIFRARSAGGPDIPDVLSAPPSPGLRARTDQTQDTVSTVHVDGINLADTTSPGRFSPPEQMPGPIGPSPIDETRWVAGIPRSCDTCRDFQRDPNGRTGFCGNAHAFGRRTMVECDQLACRSSVGVWWLPNDDFWLDRAEISHHTRPTPFLDAILSELRSATR
jgi:hypothetical protein